MKEIKDKIYGELLQANQQDGWKDRRKENYWKWGEEKINDENLAMN